MSELLDQFLQATEWPGLMGLAHDLSVRNDPADVPGLQKALRDPREEKRYAAAYALGSSRRDKRAVSPLIRVLGNQQESARFEVRLRSASACWENAERSRL